MRTPWLLVAMILKLNPSCTDRGIFLRTAPAVEWETTSREMSSGRDGQPEPLPPGFSCPVEMTTEPGSGTLMNVSVTVSVLPKVCFTPVRIKTS